MVLYSAKTASTILAKKHQTLHLFISSFHDVCLCCYQQDILTTFDQIWFWNSSPVAQILCYISANHHGQGWHLYIPQISTTIAWMVVLWMVTGHLLPNSWSPFNAFSFSTYNTPEYFYGPLGTLPPSFVPTKTIILGQTMMFWCLNLSRVLCKKKIENWT